MTITAFRQATRREQIATEEFLQVTDRSISDARQAMLRERRALEALGVKFDPFRDGQLLRERRTKA